MLKCLWSDIFYCFIWKSIKKYRVNTKYVNFWLHFGAQSPLSQNSNQFNCFLCYFLCPFWKVWGLSGLMPESCEHTSLKSTSYNRTQAVHSAVLGTTSFSDKWLHSRAVSQSFTPSVLSIDLFREFNFDCVLKTGISLKQEEILTRRIC